MYIAIILSCLGGPLCNIDRADLADPPPSAAMCSSPLYMEALTEIWQRANPDRKIAAAACLEESELPEFLDEVLERVVGPEA